MSARAPGMSPVPRARMRSIATPVAGGGAFAFEAAQKLKAEVQRLKWDLKLAEGTTTNNSGMAQHNLLC